MKKEPFLELGASGVPNKKTTHAVDLDSKRKTEIVIKKSYTENSAYPTTISKFEQRLKSMDYKFGFNYNTKKFPWPNNSFKTVYSIASLGNYGNSQNAFHEAYRVLKHGGKIIIDNLVLTRAKELKIKQQILNAKFKNIKIRLKPKGDLDNKYYVVKLTASKL